jgi:hypothetical protein
MVCCNQHHKTQLASQVHHVLQMGAGLGPDFKAGRPQIPQLSSPTCAAYLMATGQAVDGVTLAQPSV